MKHLKFVFASLAFLGSMSANAQDVVNITDYITNANFTEYGTPVSVGVCTYAKDMEGNGTTYSQLVPVEAWNTPSNGDARAGGIFAPGSGAWLGGPGYTVPATDSNGDTNVNILGTVGVWTGQAQYTSAAFDLWTPGTYTMVVAVYNSAGGTDAFDKSLIGVIESNGTEHLAPKRVYSVNQWTYEFVKFYVENTFNGYISLGYKSTNVGSAKSQHLFFSGLELYRGEIMDQDAYVAEKTAAREAKEAKVFWDAAVAAAQAALNNPDYANVAGADKAALEAELAKAEPTTKEDYNTATAALKAATDAFIAAKVAYDLAASIPELPYADQTKKPVVNEATVGAELLSAIRAYYESNAAAEGVEGAVDMRSSILNNDATVGNNNWTWTGNKNEPRNAESWTDANGKNDYMYFDGGNWNGTGWTTTMEQSITIPAGRYLLTAKGRAADGVTLTMSVGEESVELPNVGNAGNVFDRGWSDGYVVFETNGDPVTILVKATTEGFHQWFSVGDFRLVQLEEIEVPMADEADYAALMEAAAPYQGLELGFDEGEYAPYNNVDAISLGLEIAQLDPEKVQNKEYTKEYINGLTERVKNIVVVPNETEVNAIYDGEFANTEANTTSGEINLPGWTKVQGIRLLVKDEATDPGLAYTDGKAALFSWGGTTLTYGEQDGYTLPLNEDELYELTFKISGWRDGDFANVLTVALDGQAQTINPNIPGKIDDAEGNPFTEVKFYLTPSADVDNSILTIYANHHFAIADLKLMKVQFTDLVLNSTDTEAPAEQYAGTVTTDRILLEGLNTIVLPFETTKEEIGAETVLEYTGTTTEDDGTITLNFTETESLSANVPYAVMMAADASAPLAFGKKEVIPAEDLTVADDNFTFVGTYVDLVKGNDVVAAGDYVAGATAFKKAKGGNRVAAYRAYLKKAEEVASEAKIAFNFDGTIVDGIQAIELLNNLSGDIYNLNGQKLQKAQKGVNIINGKKVLVK